MSTLSPTQARAALHALFETTPTFFAPPPEPLVERPTNLDDVIAKDAALPWEFESYRWYRAVDVTGVTRVFRFQRGKSLEAWCDLLVKQRLLSLVGPFRTQTQALSPN